MPATKQTWRQKLLRLCFCGNSERTPLKWIPTLVTLFAMFSSSISVTFVFPLLPDMCLHFGYKEVDKGYYTGLIASCVFIGRVLSCYPWGWLSDKKGRRPIMLCCLLGTMVCNISFAFSTSLVVAMLLRLTAGLFHGILGVGKTIMYELSDETNQAIAMSVSGLAWGAGVIVGPLVAGYLYEPALRFPEYFADVGIFSRFQSLLPCIAIALINALSLAFAWWKLPETLNLESFTYKISDNCVSQDQDTSNDRTLKPASGGYLPSTQQIEDAEESTASKCNVSAIQIANIKKGIDNLMMTIKDEESDDSAIVMFDASEESIKSKNNVDTETNDCDLYKSTSKEYREGDKLPQKYERRDVEIMTADPEILLTLPKNKEEKEEDKKNAIATNITCEEGENKQTKKDKEQYVSEKEEKEEEKEGGEEKEEREAAAEKHEDGEKKEKEEKAAAAAEKEEEQKDNSDDQYNETAVNDYHESTTKKRDIYQRSSNSNGMDIAHTNTKTRHNRYYEHLYRTSEETCCVVIPKCISGICAGTVESKPKEKEHKDVKEKQDCTFGSCCRYAKSTKLFALVHNRQVRLVLIIYMLFSYGTIGWEEVFIVWTSTEVAYHGLGFQADDIGFVIGVSAVPLLLIQFVIFPFAERKFGSKRTFIYFGWPLTFIVTVIASLRIFQDQKSILWSLLVILLMLHKMMTMACFSAVSLLINNSISTMCKGSLNGLAITLSSIGRGVSPVVVGSLFSWSLTGGSAIGFPFDVNFAFFTCGIVYIITNVMCSQISDKLDRKFVPEKNVKSTDEYARARANSIIPGYDIQSAKD